MTVKSDSSLLFRKLSELNSSHRIIMTGVCLYFFFFLHKPHQKALDPAEQQYTGVVQPHEFS
jgi:hypothetical protein